MQNKGRLAKNKRDLFSEVTDEELAKIEKVMGEVAERKGRALRPWTATDASSMLCLSIPNAELTPFSLADVGVPFLSLRDISASVPIRP
jgi:hypothetical protein